jgi:hypothetical protein
MIRSTELYAAIRRQFVSKADLVKTCRELYLGFDGQRLNPILPYVELTIVSGSRQEYSFGADFDRFALQFNVFTKTQLPTAILQTMDVLAAVFDRATLEIEGGFIVELNRVNVSGPRIVDGVYSATLEYEALVQHEYAVMR